MRENYGLICCWNVKNNCFVAEAFDYPPCTAMGETRVEAVMALEAERQAWQETAQEAGINTTSSGYAPMEMPMQIVATASPMARVSARMKKPDTRQSLVQKIQKAFTELQNYEAEHSIPLEMEITFNPCIVCFRGDMDLNSMPAVRDQIRELTKQEKRIIFDLIQVVFIDSVGLGILVDVRKKVTFDKGIVCIVTPQAAGSQVKRVLRLGRFDAIMPLCSSLEEAKELVAPAGAGAS